MNDNELLQLVIRDRDKEIFNGRVTSVTSYNIEGKFDVLPQHANFISLIEKFLEFVDTEGKTHKMNIRNGIARVNNNLVKIYLGIGS